MGINGKEYSKSIDTRETIEKIFVADDFKQKVKDNLIESYYYNETTELYAPNVDGNRIRINNGIANEGKLRVISSDIGFGEALDLLYSNIYKLYDITSSEEEPFMDALGQIILPSYINRIEDGKLYADIIGGVGSTMQRVKNGTYNGPEFEFENSMTEGSAKIEYSKELDGSDVVELKVEDDTLKIFYDFNNNLFTPEYVIVKGKGTYELDKTTKIFNLLGGLPSLPEKIMSLEELTTNYEQNQDDINGLFETY